MKKTPTPKPANRILLSKPTREEVLRWRKAALRRAANSGPASVRAAARAVLAFLLLCFFAGCAVDYGHPRWVFVDPTLDDDWFDVFETAAEAWGTATNRPGLLRVTRNRAATHHIVRPMMRSECVNSSSGPGTSLVDSLDFDKRHCIGRAWFNGSVGVYTVGIVWYRFEQNPVKLNYYTKLAVAEHEFGHILGCGHVENSDAIMHIGLKAPRTEARLQLDDLIEYFDNNE